MKIESLDHLKQEAFNPKEPEIMQEFYISLSGGIARSDKRIHFDGEIFSIHHEMDDVFEDLSEEEFKKTFLFEALEKGALHKFKQIKPKENL